MSDTLLATTLLLAVPLHAAELAKLPWSDMHGLAQEATQTIASEGDVILFRAKKKGETAAAFNKLARGVAILSFVPGGVTCFGQHFESRHPELTYP